MNNVKKIVIITSAFLITGGTAAYADNYQRNSNQSNANSTSKSIQKNNESKNFVLTNQYTEPTNNSHNLFVLNKFFAIYYNYQSINNYNKVRADAMSIFTSNTDVINTLIPENERNINNASTVSDSTVTNSEIGNPTITNNSNNSYNVSVNWQQTSNQSTKSGTDTYLVTMTSGKISSIKEY